MKFDTAQEAQSAFELAFGRILRMGARESQSGDISEYERCKWICFDAAEYLGINTQYIEPHSRARDCMSPSWND